MWAHMAGWWCRYVHSRFFSSTLGGLVRPGVLTAVRSDLVKPAPVNPSRWETTDITKQLQSKGETVSIDHQHTHGQKLTTRDTTTTNTHAHTDRHPLAHRPTPTPIPTLTPLPVHTHLTFLDPKIFDFKNKNFQNK